MNVLRRFLWFWCRWPSVVLFDFDGEERTRLLRRMSDGTPYAKRLSVRHVTLLPGGLLGNGCYARRWAPAFDCTLPPDIPNLIEQPLRAA